MSDSNRRGPREPVGERIDPGGGPDEEDPELSAIEWSLDEGLVYVDDYRWIVREEAEEEFGAARVAEMVEQQEVQFRAYLRRRRGEADLPEADDGLEVEVYDAFEYDDPPS